MKKERGDKNVCCRTDKNRVCKLPQIPFLVSCLIHGSGWPELVHWTILPLPLREKMLNLTPSFNKHVRVSFLWKWDALGPGTLCWDLGPFEAVLQGLPLDTPLLQQQSTKKLKITARMRSWGKFWTKDTKRPKTQLWPLKSPEQKQGTAHAPCTRHHLRGGQPT